MEYLEDQTLDQRLIAGALSLDEVLSVAIDIADLLETAHRRGIVLGNLKPSDITLTKDGATLAGSDLVNSNPKTPYMAPEQLDGCDPDTRTDIFAFGAVLYEMVTGKKAFNANNEEALQAAIFVREPPSILTIKPAMPRALDHVIKKCLSKERDGRWQTIRDLSDELKWIRESLQEKEPATPTAGPYRTALWQAAAVILLLVTGLAVGNWWAARSKVDDRPVRLSIPAPDNAAFSFYSSLEISPDGRQVAFIAVSQGQQRLWVRPLNSLQGRALPGTEGAFSPFWSPDSQYLGYIAAGNIYKVALAGDAPQLICAASVCDAAGYGGGAAWSGDVIVFRHDRSGTLHKVSVEGGRPSQLTEISPANEETSHGLPHFLPDGKHFLYLAHSMNAENNAVYVASIDSTERRRLFAADSEARYAAPGYILFGNRGALMARRLDPKTLEVSPDSFPVVNAVQYDAEPATLDMSVSSTGVLVYRAGTKAARMVWVDRNGSEIGAAATPGEYRDLALSPDGKRVIFDRYEPQIAGRSLWLFDLNRGTSARLTFDSADDSDAVWHPDGERFVFSSNRSDFRALYERRANGSSQDEALITTDLPRMSPRDWSFDGRYILYDGTAGRNEAWVLPVEGDRKPFRLVMSDSANFSGDISPNNKWVAYMSTESGKRQIYVQSFLSSGGKWQISTDGGQSPLWRVDGKELFYIAGDGQMMSVPIAQEEPFQAGLPRSLFQTNLPDWTLGGWARYGVSSDGQRFLINVPSKDTSLPITVVLNWTADLD